jgi:hypothetical protein
MTFGQRIGGVLRLDAAVFEEIEANRAVTDQAVAVVIAASLAQAAWAAAALDVIGILHEALLALVRWGLFATITYVIGAWILRDRETRTNPGELLRVMGFAFAPMCLATLTVLPISVLARPIRLVAELWVLAATVIAVRQAFDYRSTKRAVIVVLIGWLIFEWILPALSGASV